MRAAQPTSVSLSPALIKRMTQARYSCTVVPTQTAFISEALERFLTSLAKGETKL